MALQAGGQRIRGQGLRRCIYHLNLYTGMSSEFCAFTLQPADRKKVNESTLQLCIVSPGLKDCPGFIILGLCLKSG